MNSQLRVSSSQKLDEWPRLLLMKLFGDAHRSNEIQRENLLNSPGDESSPFSHTHPYTPIKNSTSVCAAGLVGLRVPLHPEPELMVAVSPRPLRLRPKDPPAVPVRPAPGGFLHESDGVTHQAGDQIVLQEQQMDVHSHVGDERALAVQSKLIYMCIKKKLKSNKNKEKQLISRELQPNLSPSVSGRGEEEETGPSWSGESAFGTHRRCGEERGASAAAAAATAVP